jgi:hypothetical protein
MGVWFPKLFFLFQRRSLVSWKTPEQSTSWPSASFSRTSNR